MSNTLCVNLSVILAASSKPSLTLVVGPTGAGKSAWALAAAREARGVIVNADSVQIYKHFDIGSAKPTPDEQAQVPHFLYSLVEPDQTFTAGDYRRAAWPVLEEQSAKGGVFLVGGSGFYVQALEKGMFDVGPVAAEIVARVEEVKTRGELYQELKRVDPASAQRIGPNDHYRLQRALELVLSEGRTMAEIQTAFAATTSQKRLADVFQVRKVGVNCDREILRNRILRRTEAMLAAGLVNEVQGLLSRGWGEAKGLASVGYREVAAYLRGELSESELVPTIVTSSMQLAKRQLTWFKRDPEIQWISSDRT